MGLLGRILKRILKISLLIAGPIAIAIAGAWFYMSTGRYVTTENAYLKTDLVIIASEVPGRVTEVAITENQRVSQGDLLFRIDAGRLEVALGRWEAELGTARQQVQALKARYRTKRAELTAAKADLEFLRTELDRSERLRKNGTISQIRLVEVRREMVRAQAELAVLAEEAAEVLAQLNGDAEMSPETHPDVMRAQAEYDRVAFDLALSEVRAPTGGIIANLNLQAGEYVASGSPVLSLVADHSYWVEANLKETDLTHLKLGQMAKLRIDAYPNVVWQGQVETVAPATGAEYALLPPQNASGNWVKVVQRIPVRLTIQPLNDDAPALRAGMSVAVSIDTGYERPLPEIVTQARAWILPEGR